jgi:hypothetical protein
VPGFGEFFKEGSAAEQFLIWGVLQQVLQPLLLPFTAELQKLVLSATPVMPLSPSVAAEAVARGFIDDGTGQDIANDNGIGQNDFHKLVKIASHAPDLSLAFELYRRGLIPEGSDDPEQVSLRGALTDAGIPAAWHDHAVKLAVSVPSQAQVLNAWLEGQITEGEARKRLKEAGMAEDWIDAAYNANGQAPTPTQALELLNRGIIPKMGTGPDSVSYQQAFLEGPWRNKWLQPFLALAEYLPPPRTVTAMYHSGQLTHDQAATALSKQGLSPEMVTAYLSKAQSATHATERHLTTSQITTAYADGIMTNKQALDALVALKFTDHDAKVILQLVDVRRATAQLNAGVSRVRALYEAGKVTADEATKLLTDLKVDGTQARAMVQVWHLTVSTRTRTLSAAQVESAFYYNLITAAEAMTMLQGMGYDEADAWLALAIRNKGTTGLPPRPASLPPAPPKPTPTPTP